MTVAAAATTTTTTTGADDGAAAAAAAATAAAAAAAGGTGAGAGAGTGTGGGTGTGTGAGTIVDPKAAAAGTGTGTAATPDWPADWRDKMAGGDAEYRKRLDRFGSPLDVGKSYRALEAKLSSGELKKTLPETATDAEKAAWRAEQGLPDKPEGYVEKLALPNGVVLGEADKPIVAEFAKAAHAGNVDPKAFNGLVAQYYALQDAQAAKRADDDAAYHDENIAALGQEWGPESKRNINMVNAFVGTTFPGELATHLLAARTPDGRLLGDNPAFIKAMAGLAREINPVGTLLPTGGADPLKTANTRLGELKALIGKRDSAYYIGPQRDALQKEYRDLLAATDKVKARGAAA